jgi:hypothetical protein
VRGRFLLGCSGLRALRADCVGDYPEHPGITEIAVDQPPFIDGPHQEANAVPLGAMSEAREEEPVMRGEKVGLACPKASEGKGVTQELGGVAPSDQQAGRDLWREPLDGGDGGVFE